jgi:putative MATE family efflux protein
MRSVGKVRLPMVATILSLAVNLVLNWLLIFGVGPFPALGVVGAGVATVVARLVELAVLVVASYRLRYPFAAGPRELLAFDAVFVRRYFRIAAPVMANELLWATGVSLQSVILARTGTAAIAAFNIVGTVSNLTWTLFIGLGNGAAALIGQRIGAGDHASARAYASRITRFAPLAAVGVGLLLWPLALTLPYLFKVEPAVLESAAAMLLILGLSYPFRAFNMSMVIGVCRAGGDTVFCAVYDTLAMWTLALPAAALAAFVGGAPVWAVYLCLCGEEPVKMLLGLWRLATGKWLRDVTRA